MTELQHLNNHIALARYDNIIWAGMIISIVRDVGFLLYPRRRLEDCRLKGFFVFFSNFSDFRLIFFLFFQHHEGIIQTTRASWGEDCFDEHTISATLSVKIKSKSKKRSE